jgi:hypothetical protein
VALVVAVEAEVEADAALPSLASRAASAATFALWDAVDAVSELVA